MATKLPRWASRLAAYRAENNEQFGGGPTPEEAIGDGSYGGGNPKRSQGVDAHQRYASLRAYRGGDPVKEGERVASKRRMDADRMALMEKEAYKQQLRGIEGDEDEEEDEPEGKMGPPGPVALQALHWSKRKLGEMAAAKQAVPLRPMGKRKKVMGYSQARS